MKLVRYIEVLNNLLKEVGDVEVFMSSDEEGNDYHSIGDTLGYSKSTLSPIDGDAIVKGVILYPEHDNWDSVESE
jgi:hypothetical protein